MDIDQDNINQVDSNGMIFLGSERVETIERHHPSEGWLWIRQEVLYKTEYLKFGVKGSAYNHGKYTEFDKDGNPHICGTCNMGHRVGLWYILGRKSEMLFKVFLDNDVAEGEVIKFIYD